MSLGANKQALMGAAGAAGGGGDFYTHQIASSIRNSSAQSGTLKRTAGTPTSRTQFTMSYWVKRYNTSGGSSTNLVFTCGSYIFWGFSVTDFDLQVTGGNWGTGYLTSDNMYRDTSAWYHHVLTFDSTQSTQADRLKIYVNGERITSFSVESVTAGIGASEDFSFINESGYAQAFGGLSGSGHGTEGADNQMAEIVFNDGQAYGPDSYGETKNGVWIPKDPSGLTFGNNGYWLKMAAGAIGTDSSGNGNTFTVTNIAAHDVMLDSPTFNSNSNGGNFATIGPLWKTSDMTFSEGNLKWTCATNERGLMSNWAVPIGTKAYWEYIPVSWGGNTSNGDEMWIGINQGIAALVGGDRGGKTTAYAYGTSNGYKTILASASSYGATIRANDVVGVAVDRVNHTINFSKNGSWQGTFAISSTMDLFPFIGSGGGTSSASGIFNFGADGTFSGTVTAQGNSDDTGYGNFYYDPPTGFLAMCAGNLPVADSIDPAQTDDDYPQKLFSPILYTGSGSGDGVPKTNTITGLGFQPDYVNIKERTQASTNPLYDSSRGNTKLLTSVATQAEVDQAALPGLVSFDTDGFKAQYPNTGDYYVNRSNNTYVAWCQRANGGSLTTNNVGTQTSYVQTDPSGAFSITKYVGTGSAMTVGHGLSVTPGITIIKDRDTVVSWPVYTKLIDGSMDYFFFDTDSASNTSGLTGPNSSVWTWQSASGLSNTASKNYIMYNFANIEGYCKVGTYVGNASNDGTFVYTGFKPSFMMNKPIVQGNWRVVDSARSPYNVTQSALSPNSTAAEDTYASVNIDLLSNGFKMRSYETPMNQATTFVYIAFAENPFKYATAR